MAIPSRVMGTGNSPQSTEAICGKGAVGLVATGTTIADAFLLTNENNTFTTSSASTGVRLLPTEVGAQIVIRNDSGVSLTIYPYSVASTINAGATSLALATAKTAVFFATSATTWVSITTA